MGVVINELEVVAGPVAEPVQGVSTPAAPEQQTNPTPADLDAVLRRLRDRQDRVRAS